MGPGKCPVSSNPLIGQANACFQFPRLRGNEWRELDRLLRPGLMIHRSTLVCRVLRAGAFSGSIVLNREQPPGIVSGIMRDGRRRGSKLKRKELFMQVTQERPEDKALTMDKCAADLGLSEFSLFSQVQSGDIKAVRSRSGEMLIPGDELERLANGLADKPSVSDGANLPDSSLGIQSRHGGLYGTELFYRVPGLEGRLLENEIPGYRAACSAIFVQLQSAKDLNQELGRERPSPESGEINTPQTGRWEVYSSLLNLNPGEILLCQRGDEFAAIERFPAGSPYAKAKGAAQMLWDGKDAQAVAEAFKADARLTLEFMASNLTAKAQKIVWEQFPDHRPGHVVAAISERCRQAVADEETIKITQTVRRGIRI